MAEGVHRLSKVAKELGVGVGTISDFLKLGKAESTPNSKITEEQYAIVRKEFEGDKKSKDEAKMMHFEKEPVFADEESFGRKKVAEAPAKPAPPPAKPALPPPVTPAPPVTPKVEEKKEK